MKAVFLLWAAMVVVGLVAMFTITLMGR